MGEAEDPRRWASSGMLIAHVVKVDCLTTVISASKHTYKVCLIRYKGFAKAPVKGFVKPFVSQPYFSRGLDGLANYLLR